MFAHKADAVRFFKPADYAFAEFSMIWCATRAGSLNALWERKESDELHRVVRIGRSVSMASPLVSGVTIADPLLDLAHDRKAGELRKERLRNLGDFGNFYKFWQMEDSCNVICAPILP
jgi:hypothetical protein